ncbi:putative F-box protein At3g16210 isoform X2 [Lotus japonicus]|nr:putative F-box protein At3g16210 isoform X2 [Lotus japonicus]
MVMMMNMEEHLPRELVSNILLRLSAEDLMKSKCVCKYWFNLITDPHFITNYYVVYNNNLMQFQSQEEKLFIIRRPFLSGLKTYISVLSWNINDPKGIVSSEILNPPYEYDSDYKYWTEIMGPCNGIYFLEGNPNVMMNPSLRQFIVLPQSPSCGSFTDYAGFGFDPKTNDYKVVVIKDQIGIWTAELYSFNSNSWRKLDAALPLPIQIWGSSRVYTFVNNCYHWFGFVDASNRTGDVVVAFDMVKESFRKIKVPKIRYSSQEDFATLVPFNESATVGVIVYPVRGTTEKGFDVWVMKDYLDEGSWTKQYTVGHNEVMYKLVGFYGSNRFLWKDSDERLALYNPDSEVKTKDLQVYGR